MNTFTASKKYHVYYYENDGTLVDYAWNQEYYTACEMADRIGGFKVRADKEQPSNA